MTDNRRPCGSVREWPAGRAPRCVAGLLTFALLLSSAGTTIAQPQQDTGLPSGFRPPPPVPAVFTIEKELITEAEFDEWKKTKRIEFNNNLTARQLSPQIKQSLEEGCRALVYEMSITARRSERDGVTKLRGAIVRNIDVLALNSNPQVRQTLLDAVVKYAADLMDGNILVRCQAVELVTSLNLTPSKPGVAPVPAVAFTGGIPLLLDAISPPQGGIDQPEAVRILAARGIERLLKEGRSTLPLNSKLPLEAAQRILAELGRPGTAAYHFNLVNALPETGISTVPNAQNQQEPAVAETLARILSDSNRSLWLRARAARVLGRIPMATSIQSAPIAYALVQLTHQIGTAMNAGQVSGKSGLFMYQDIFLAFNPQTPGEVLSDGRTKAGLRATLAQKPIADAYADVLPIIQATFNYYAVNPEAIPVDAPKLQKLATWQAPADMKIAPGGKAITTPMFQTAAATAPPAAATAAPATATAPPATTAAPAGQ